MMQKNVVSKNPETQFINLYKMVLERENFLTNDAKILQYNAVLEYFFKFLEKSNVVSNSVLNVLFGCYMKMGDVFYNEGIQLLENNKLFLAVDYYNQALKFAQSETEKNRILDMLKNVYSFLDDKEALIKVEESWAENQDARDRFSVYMLLAKEADNPKDKAMLLEKALNEVTKQEMSFYNKFQDTLNVCSQLIVLYELLKEKDKLQKIRKLQEDTLKLLN